MQYVYELFLFQDIPVAFVWHAIAIYLVCRRLKFKNLQT